MTNIKDIAEMCGLSVSTVSKALNGYTDISAETKHKVMKVAQSCGYLPNSMARALKTNRTHNLGVLFTDEGRSGLKQEYFAAVLDAFKTEAEAHSYDITFIGHNQNAGGRTMTYLEHCRYRNFDGVCIACVDFQQPEVLELINSSIPVITIDHVFNNHTSINSANVDGMKELVEYIYRMGHRKIAYVHGEKSAVTDQRLTSFCRMLRDFGIDVPKEYLVLSAYHDIRSTGEATRRLLALPDRPSCIVMPDDYAAFGGIKAIESAGLKIPDDISVAGYDGIPLAEMIRPHLTTLKQDTARMGQEAARRLIEQIESPMTTIAESITIKGTLLPGQTVAKMPAAV